PGAGDGPVGVLGGALGGPGEDLLRPGVPHLEGLAGEGLDLDVVDDVSEELGAHDDSSGVVSVASAARRSVMVTSPAAKWSMGISVTMTRTASVGATPESTSACVTPEIIERMVSGVRPSVRVTWTTGTSLTPVDPHGPKVREVEGDRRSRRSEVRI